MTKERISKKIISCFMLCALMMSSIMGFAISSNAAVVDGSQGGKAYYVGTPWELNDAYLKAQDGDYIVFTNDIVCSGNRYVYKNIIIDFDYHSLKFTGGSDGLYISVSRNATLRNGAIYGANDSNSAVRICGGNLNLECMWIYGGDCKYCSYNNGNGIYSNYSYNNIHMNGCCVKGGNGYRKGYNYNNQTGKAIYGGKVIKEGMGYIAVDGACK